MGGANRDKDAGTGDGGDFQGGCSVGDAELSVESHVRDRAGTGSTLLQAQCTGFGHNQLEGS